MKNNALTSPPYKCTQRKPPWCSKTDFARLATPADKAVEAFLSSLETMPLHHLYANVHRESSQENLKNDFGPVP